MKLFCKATYKNFSLCPYPHNFSNPFFDDSFLQGLTQIKSKNLKQGYLPTCGKKNLVDIYKSTCPKAKFLNSQTQQEN